VTRTAEAHTALVDRARLAADAAAERAAFEAPFKALQAKARANRDAMLRTPRTWALA